MCCGYSQEEIDKLKAKHQKNKWVWGWKKVRADGRALVGKYQYRPGTHASRVRSYNPKRPRGFHIFLGRPSELSARVATREGYEWRDRAIWIRVRADINDLVRVGPVPTMSKWSRQQAVFRKIVITEKVWKDANLVQWWRGKKKVKK